MRSRKVSVFLGAVALVLIAILFIVFARVVHPGGPCWDSAFRCESLNNIRDNNGRNTLEQRGNLQEVADLWAEYMANSGVLNHNPSLNAQTVGVVGENVGYGPDWQTVFRAFMDSPLHRANMLDSGWTQIGIGAAREDNRVWIVLVFR